MKSIVLIAVVLLAVRATTESTSANSHSVCETLYLLNIVPYPDSRTFAGWDRGFDVIPAGHLATRHINNNPDVLPGYKLEVIDVASEACGISLIVEGFTGYYIQSTNAYSCVYGVVGLYCSTVTDAIAPFANHPDIGHVQLAASTSPLHRDTTSYPYTFHTISFSRIFNEAMISLMDEFAWKQVNIVFDPVSFFFQSTATDFIELIKSDPEKKIASAIPLQPIRESIVDVFNSINKEAARIGYFSVSQGELIVTFFCEAYKRNFSWPGYAYILQEWSLQQIYSTEVNCTREQIIRALEGTFLLQYRLFGLQGTRLVSRMTYEEYHDQYISELEELAQDTGMDLQDNVYANTLYDQVWAFALAANLTTDELDFINISMSHNSVEHLIHARNILAENLNRLSFDGVSGFIDFGVEQEVLTSVEIYQVQNGTQVLIGEYNAYNRSVVLKENFDRSTVPSDTFEVRYHLIPHWLGILVFITDIFLLLLILFNAFVIVRLKNQPEIKSGSYVLSMILLIACAILSLSPFFETIIEAYVIQVPVLFTIFCNIQLWCFICGNFLIFVTLIMRLLRVFHVFRSYHSTGKYWADKYLLLYIVMVFSSILIVLVLWTLLDRFTYKVDEEYIPTGQPPYFLLHEHCSSRYLNIWLAVTFGMIGLAMVFLIFLAIQTRRIKRKHFKDTKKVNIFIFGTSSVYTIFFTLWLILAAVDYVVLGFVCLMVAQFAGPLLCQLLLFLPKTIPAILNRKKH